MRVTGQASLLLALGFAGTALASHDAAPGMTHHVAQNDLGTMAYDVYAPEHLANGTPLFVHLHGANNKTIDAAHRSRLNELAGQRGFVVVYPQEDPGANNGIWDYGVQVDEGRDGRASSLVAKITREVMAAHGTDPKRIFIGGISAGAGVALVMAVQYPELYAAVQIETGAKYIDSTVEEAGKRVYEVMGPRARRIPLMLSYGTADPIAIAEDEESVVDHWMVALDWIDDGEGNGSVSVDPAATRTGTEGKNYSVDTYVDRNGCVFAERWLIEGMTHAYAGGAQVATYGPGDAVSDPNAPNMRKVAYDFFLDQLDANGPPCPSPGAGDVGDATVAGTLDVTALLLLLALRDRRRQTRGWAR